jgi:predicted ArsR family transcriptional regulator
MDKPKSTRLRLLDFLRAHPDSTAADLARGLRLTRADVRYHLNLLLSEGVVAETGKRVRGRGRPARSLRLTSTVNPQRFDLMANALLSVNLAGLNPKETCAYLGQIALQLIATVSPPSSSTASQTAKSQSLAGRLVESIARLNDLGYRARWEAHADWPRIILEHCPFSALYAEHPGLEQLDAVLLEGLLGMPVVQLSSQAKGLAGVHAIYGIETSQKI